MRVACGCLHFRLHGNSGDILRAGESTELHAHNFSHVVMCLWGGPLQVEAMRLDDPTRVEWTRELRAAKPDDLLNWFEDVEAGRVHRLTAISDAFYCCTHTHRDMDGELSQTYVGAERSYE